MITTTYDLLAEHPFLAGMTREALTDLAPSAHRSVFRHGGPIFVEGGHADRFWLIREGRVRLHTHAPGRGDLTIETLGPGTVLGWSWLSPPYRWHFGATAMEPTLTVVFEADEVRRLCARDPVIGYELHRRFMAVVVDRLQNTRMRLLDLYANDGP
jgi:CRP/FNR family transcriptional regulator, cyclic AMP receptor protein